MDIEDEYTELVKAHLKSLKVIFMKELFKVSNQNFSDEVKFLQIEYDSPMFSRNFSVCMYAMDKEGKLVEEVYWFLKSMAVVVPAEIYDTEKYEEIEPWSTASSILESWLMACWAKTGNQKYPTYLAHHDSYFMRDISNGSKTNWDKIIEDANG